jgi:hypothetical protein
MKLTTKYLCFLLLSFTVIKSFAQKSNENFYAFNADWSAAKSVDASTYFMHEIKKSDTEYVCRYYNKFGPMIKQESFRDADLSIPNGVFCWYNSGGYLDSSGSVLNGRKDGSWGYFMNDSLKRYSEKYEGGKLIEKEVYQKRDTTQTEKDTTQKEATYGKVEGAWNKYISSKIGTPDRFVKNMPTGRYVVTVSFVINKTGKVQDVVLLKSVEWSADAEVFKAIENSPVWTPAMQKGLPVLYRQKQNISFAVSNN